MTHTNHRIRTWRRLAAALLMLGVVVVAAGCEDEALVSHEADAGALFDRYVALGNSITAGYQSGGINSETQAESYANLVAQAMGTDFNMPLLAMPGCPPPIQNIFTGERIAELPSGCALRVRPVPAVINDVAVPGAQVLDLVSNLAEGNSANPLTTFLLGGRTQLEAAIDADPTFASIWIGNNDVLGAALSGDLTLLTPLQDFETRYTEALDGLEDAGVQGGVLIGVADVTLVPNLSMGQVYALAKQQGSLPPIFEVADNCATDGAMALVPFAYGFGTLLSQASQGTPVTLDCLNDPPVLTPSEGAVVAERLQAINAFIESEADARGWAYYDPNVAFREVRNSGGIPLFPNVPPSPESVTEPFGPYFSKDGVHPSALTHREIVANGVIDAINAKYGTSIPNVE